MIDSQITKLEEKMAKLKNQVEEIDEEKKKGRKAGKAYKFVLSKIGKIMKCGRKRKIATRISFHWRQK